jgi:hypothetical protein
MATLKTKKLVQGAIMLTETKTLDRVRAEHLSDHVREQLGLRPDEEIKLTVEPVESTGVLLSPGKNLQEQYERFFKESGLFIEVSEEEKQRYQPVSEERLKELAAKLGAAGPLSEVIIEERGMR